MSQDDRTDLELHVNSCSDRQLHLETLCPSWPIRKSETNASSEIESGEFWNEERANRLVEAIREANTLQNSEESIQSTIGDFRFVREVGRGGMGVVYEAEQVSLRRRVALKVLPSQKIGDSSRKSRFRREVLAAARLHHTNIVPVFGVGEENGVSYYIMQLISGMPLDEMIRQHQSGRKAPRHRLMLDITQSSPLQIERELPEIPRDLATIINKSTTREPADRYQTAASFEEDLHRYLQDEPILARRLSPVEQLSRWVRRNRSLAMSLTTIAALLLVGLGLSLFTAVYFRQLERKQRQLAVENLDLAEQRETARLEAIHHRQGADFGERQANVDSSGIEFRLGGRSSGSG